MANHGQGELEAIIDVRKVDGKYQYLVRLVGRPEENDEWTWGAQFEATNKRMIREYFHIRQTPILVESIVEKKIDSVSLQTTYVVQYRHFTGGFNDTLSCYELPSEAVQLAERINKKEADDLAAARARGFENPYYGGLRNARGRSREGAPIWSNDDARPGFRQIRDPANP